MTKMKLLDGSEVFTELPVDEVSHYLNGGIRTGWIKGWLDQNKSTPIRIHTKSILFIYS